MPSFKTIYVTNEYEVTIAPRSTLADLVEASFEKYTDNPALSCLKQTFTFNDIDQKSKALAVWLQRDSGLNQGDRVAIQLTKLGAVPDSGLCDPESRDDNC